MLFLFRGSSLISLPLTWMERCPNLLIWDSLALQGSIMKGAVNIIFVWAMIVIGRNDGGSPTLSMPNQTFLWKKSSLPRM